MTQLAFSDKSLAQAPNSNALALFLDGEDGILKIKDIRGVIAPLTNYVDTQVLWGEIQGTLSNQTDLQQALDLKANQNAVVLLTGNQDISGVKNFELRVGIGQGLTPDPTSHLHIDSGASVNRVIMDADNNVARIFSFRTDNSQRWAFRVDGNETGSGNVGGDFAIRRYSDAGAFIDSPISIVRSTGAVTIPSLQGYCKVLYSLPSAVNIADSPASQILSLLTIPISEITTTQTFWVEVQVSCSPNASTKSVIIGCAGSGLGVTISLGNNIIEGRGQLMARATSTKQLRASRIQAGSNNQAMATYSPQGVGQTHTFQLAISTTAGTSLVIEDAKIWTML